MSQKLNSAVAVIPEVFTSEGRSAFTSCGHAMHWLWSESCHKRL
jgi:hypothetical protein